MPRRSERRGVSRFLGKPISIGKSLEQRIQKIEEPVALDSIPPKVLARARYLARMYYALRRRYTGERYYGSLIDSSQFHVFVRLALSLGKSVDPRVYLKAHFAFYGPDVYPNQLLSRHAWFIYNQYSLVTTAPIVAVDRAAYNARILSELAQAWNVKPSVIMAAMPALFESVNE